MGTAFVIVITSGCGTGVAVAIGAGVGAGVVVAAAVVAGGVVTGVVDSGVVAPVGAGEPTGGTGTFFAGIGGSSGIILITG